MTAKPPPTLVRDRAMTAPPPIASLLAPAAHASPHEDAAMRNAIALLTLPDSESALVYALVHDAEFRLAAALTSNASRLVDVTVVRALLQVFDGYEDQLRRFVSQLMLKEMVETLNWNELFRANSATTALIREYTLDLGQDFLQAAFQDVLAEIWDLPAAYEVNPVLLAPGQDLEANRVKLAALATELLTRVFDAAHLFPYQIAKIYRAMEAEMTRLIDRSSSSSSAVRLSAIGEDAGASSLPRLSAISEDLHVDEPFVPRGSLSSGSSNSSNSAGLSAAKEEFYVHLGGFLFLRFLCPALILPHTMGLTPHDCAPSKPLQRTLVLVAKLFQSLANNAEYGQREAYMAPFNGLFLQHHRAPLVQFYDQIAQQAQHDNRRESVILRSNLAPRLSQLWAAGRSSASSLAGPPRVASVDDAIAVLQKWMHENLDAVTKQVATNGKPAKRKSLSTTASGSELSPVAKKHKDGGKPRLLKSAKHLSPLALESEEEEEEGEEGEEKEEEEDEEDVSLPADVSKEELERLMGLTSHRDIQLMKIYYASLAQHGLQRLLRCTSATNNSEWTLYRSRNAVDVFKREDPLASTPACGGSGSSSLTSGGYVEMKASVEIHATPRQVFKYLRSLDRMNEWDDHVTRKVEPLDDSKVVLYRAQPKLSLWPTWLVKPRDSCDLHSFVERTGQADTYAVVMESVPRPDVPTRKGTVRMAFATGGFVVAPGPVSETHGLTTTLTGVVKADFKGALPRFLAESVCFRQVLSVRAIKLRLETARQHGNSSWV